MITWREIKLYTLQKMFSADGNNIPTDDSTKDYIAGMPEAANEALQLLATAGKFIIKSIDIAHNPVRNLLTDGDRIHSMERGTITFAAEGARSAYLECVGNGICKVLVNGECVAERALESKKGYREYRFLIPNTEDQEVMVLVESAYPLAVKNAALYSADFETEEDIQSYAEKVRYDLRELADDFYMLDTGNIYFEGQEIRYTQTTDYFQEGNKVLVLDRETVGNYRIYYKAYPQKITADTEDEAELSIDDEVATLLPLYMASQLYKDDDAGIATTYRNEFEVALERLRNAPRTPTAERFVSESGWI